MATFCSKHRSDLPLSDSLLSLLKFKTLGYSHITPLLSFTIRHRFANKRNYGRKTFHIRQNYFSRSVQTKTAPAVYNLYNLDVFVGRWSGTRESPCRGPSLQTVARSERSQFSSRRASSMGRNFSLREERSVACGFDPQRCKYLRLPHKSCKTFTSTYHLIHRLHHCHSIHRISCIVYSRFKLYITPTYEAAH